MAKARISFESLEERVVPTTMRWHSRDSNFDWNNNGNWDKKVAGVWVEAIAIPANTDDVEFQPGAGLNQRCELTNTGPDIRSLKLVNGFTAPIKVGRTITADGRLRSIP